MMIMSYFPGVDAQHMPLSQDCIDYLPKREFVQKRNLKKTWDTHIVVFFPALLSIVNYLPCRQS